MQEQQTKHPEPNSAAGRSLVAVGPGEEGRNGVPTGLLVRAEAPRVRHQLMSGRARVKGKTVVE